MFFSVSFEFFSFFSVCFESVAFVSVISKRIRNTETNRNNRKNVLLVSRNKPKKIEFRFVSVRTENFFCLFRGHPSANTVIPFLKFLFDRNLEIYLDSVRFTVPVYTIKVSS
jgi:hypothetical protein